jgi:hypothetical protein
MPRNPAAPAPIPAKPPRQPLGLNPGHKLLLLLTETDEGWYLDEIRGIRDAWQFKFPVAVVESGDPLLDRIGEVTFCG